MKYCSYLKRRKLINLKRRSLNFQEFTMNIEDTVKKLEQEDCVNVKSVYFVKGEKNLS